MLQAAARVDGHYYQDITVMPGSQVLDQRHCQALIDPVRVIDDHHRRHLHRRCGDRPGGSGDGAVLPGRAVIPRLACRGDCHPGNQEPDRSGQPGDEQAEAAHPQAQLGDAAEPVQL
jgi:hypothetical protein